MPLRLSKNKVTITTKTNSKMQVIPTYCQQNLHDKPVEINNTQALRDYSKSRMSNPEETRSRAVFPASAHRNPDPEAVYQNELYGTLYG